MIDFPWSVDVGKMAKTSSGLRISNKASFCGSDSGTMSAKRFRRTDDKISSKILLEIKTHRLSRSVKLTTSLNCTLTLQRQP